MACRFCRRQYCKHLHDFFVHVDARLCHTQSSYVVLRLSAMLTMCSLTGAARLCSRATVLVLCSGRLASMLDCNALQL